LHFTRSVESPVLMLVTSRCPFFVDWTITSDTPSLSKSAALPLTLGSPSGLGLALGFGLELGLGLGFGLELGIGVGLELGIGVGLELGIGVGLGVGLGGTKSSPAAK
jgi:hypothetical protein